MSFITNALSLIPLFLVKLWNNQKLYLQLIMPLVGFIDFALEKSFNKLLLPLLVVFCMAVFQGIYLKDLGVIIRGVQGILMVLFANYLSKKFEEKHIINIVKSSVLLSIGYYICEYIFLKPLPMKEVINGIFLMRFSGLIGESNFSALLIFALASFSFYFKRYFLFILCFLILLPLMSRMGIILVVLIPISMLLLFLKENKFKFIINLTLILICLSPIIIGLLDTFLSDLNCLMLSKLTNGRFAIAAGYWKMFIQNPLGVGFYKGPESILSFIPAKYSLEQFNYHQHSMYVQTLSELGLQGLIVLNYFLLKFTNFLIEQDRKLSILWLILLFGLMSLNSFSEFAFYLFIGWGIKGQNYLSIQLFGRNAYPS